MTTTGPYCTNLIGNQSSQVAMSKLITHSTCYNN